MSEIKKNIETCRGEDVLAEVSAAPQDPHFGSLVNEAFDPMQQQALHQAGYDGYSEVIEQHKPYTFASAIVQMKSNLLLLLRALWQFPFGAGTLRSLSDDASLRSLSDMWQHYITRLSGNETYGIPSRLSSLTDLPSAPLLVADRKISGADVPDGMSFAQLLCGAETANLTEITDDNSGWTMTVNLPTLTNVQKMTLGCKEMSFYFSGYADDRSSWGVVNGLSQLTELNTPYLEKFVNTYGNNQQSDIIKNCANLEVWYAPKFKSFNASYLVYGCPKLRKVVWGTLQNDFITAYSSYSCNFEGSNSNLVHFEICADGGQLARSLTLSWWNPTNALDASLDTLVTDEDCHNNLEQFLKNFRTYIALRLADNGSGKTLTLSAAVFSSIWDANGNPQVLRDGLDQLRADIHNIVKTTKHWDVNKAN